MSKTRAKNICQNMEEAVKYFKIAANNNHSGAQYFLECIYYYVYCREAGIEQNITKAIEYGEKAAKRVQ